ncbi:mitofilin family membrane protein [Azospirillum halopraeferens]|uniref:mitofilin family membrane protein n=1 Tax=Azospirillum halopraeferens TaxID=34010 RepID=UPI000423171E|nr:mitofilin family membrane protein [Azospirillum halopraeferens]
MTPRPGSDHPEGEPTGQTPSESPSATDGAAVERIIERFGGIRPMAHKLDTPVTTVQGWKKRGAIPLSRHPDLRAAAVKFGIPLDEADLEAATPAEDRSPPTGEPADAAGTVPETGAAAPEPQDRDEAPAAAAATPPTATPTAAGERPYSPPTPVVTQDTRSGGAGFATFVSLVALLVGTAALTERWWAPHVPGWQAEVAAEPDPVLSERIRTLDDRIAALESRPAPAAGVAPGEVQALADRLAELEQRPAPAAGNGTAAGGADPAALDALAERVAALENRPAEPAAAAEPAPDPRVGQLADAVTGLRDSVGTLEGRLSAVDANARAAEQLDQRLAGLRQEVEQLAGLRQEVEQLAGRVQAGNDREAAMQALVLAAGQLRSALAAGQPFRQELDAVRSLGIRDDAVAGALDAVAPYADRGIPTRPQLAERFEPLGSSIVRADIRGEGGDWLDQVRGTVSTLVTVRRQGGGVVGDSAEAVVARAEAAVREGSLTDAVRELETLRGPAAEVAADWVQAARARLAADTAMNTLSGRAIALLGEGAR